MVRRPGVREPSLHAESFLYPHSPVTPDDYKEIVSGGSRLMLHVYIEYKGPELAARCCYLERIIYDYRSASFRHSGGTDKCTNSDVF